MKKQLLIILIMLICILKNSTAQIAVQSYSTTTSPGNGPLITIAKPSGLAIGDLMVAQIGINTNNSTVIPSGGWTLIIEDLGATTGLTCLYKLADAADVAATDFTFTMNIGPQTQQGILMRITGASSTNPITTSAQDYVSGANPTFNNSVTPIAANSLIIMSAANGLFGMSSPSIAVSNPVWTTLPQNTLGSIFYAVRPQTTATGNASFIATNSNWLCQMIIITPQVDITSNINSHTNVSCKAGNDGTATVNASGGIGALTYSWIPIGGNAATAIGLSANTYTCIVTDSIGTTDTVSVTITEPNAITSSQSLTICSDSSISVGINNYSLAGIYLDTINATNGCDSIITTNLIVNQIPNVTASATATNVCAGLSDTLTGGGAMTYLWTNGVINGIGFVPTATNTYTVTGTDGNNCFNTATILVTVNPSPIDTIQQAGNILVSQYSTGNQWYCNDTLIPGATNLLLTATPSVTTTYCYFIRVTSGLGCIATSDTVCFLATGISTIKNDNSFSIYPNPTSGQFTISLPTDNSTIIVTDLIGQQILKTQTKQNIVNLQLDKNGVYIIYILTTRGMTARKLTVYR